MGVQHELGIMAIMQAGKKPRSGVFIDSANLLWGALKMNPKKQWFVDFQKLNAYLKNNHNPAFVKYYDTVDLQPRTDRFVAKAKAKAQFHAKLNDWGYEIITKPLKYIKQKDGTFQTKGNMDIELAMGIIKTIDSLDLVILISGDSDYLAPIELVHDRGKSILIISFDELLSWELRTFAGDNKKCKYLLLEDIKNQIGRTKKTKQKRK